MLWLLYEHGGTVLGIVRVDRRQRRVLKVEKAEIRESQLLQLATRLGRDNPTVFSVFEERARFMSEEFGPQAAIVQQRLLGVGKLSSGH